MSDAVRGTRKWGRVALLVVAAIAMAALAAVVTVAGTLEGWWQSPVAARGDTKAFLAAANAKIDARSHGNTAFVLLEHGKPVGSHFVSKGKPVNGDTLFQVASLSKWITAMGVMKLVEEGKLDLDAPVSKYLTRWHLPKSNFDNDKVTIRRILSHTAGLTDGLGYTGFEPGKKVQTLEESLTGTADASPGASGLVRVGIEPATAFKYSGGGYTILQLVIEEVSGRAFNDYMRTEILVPFGMTHSTFVLDAVPNPDVAEIYDTDGTFATHYKFTALAAASLYTCTSDLTHFIQAQLPGPGGEMPGRGILKPETLKKMRMPEAFMYGIEIWGLGTILYAPNNEGGYIVGHDGNNAPAINTAARFDPATGDGIVVLETGAHLLATQVAGDWVFWHTGKVDVFAFQLGMAAMLRAAAIAAGIAFLLTLVLGWRFTRRRT